jgi:glyoxylase-like metal-dependent hydrolase (beta-lactamase superfamily II)/rhodanese-related sulfurtransferase
MFFRQLFDQDSSTYSYLLADARTHQALLIDPVLEQFARDSTLIEELGFQLLYVLETHVHADHVTGSGLLRERFGAKSVVSERAGVVCPDVQVKHGDRLQFGGHTLEVRETPGHTSGCLSYVCSDARMVFTGDALLIRACGRTDFQQGDSSALYRSIHEQIFSLPDDFAVYPGHDYKGRTASSVAEEKRLNPRVGLSKSLDAFVNIMRELRLPYPRKIDVALPANARCGIMQPIADSASELLHDWAAIEVSPVGVPELTAERLSELPRAHARLVDVREQDEYRGELGHIAGTELVPLSTLVASARPWPKHEPVVLICRSGGRSAKAVLQLAAAGFKRVASLQGGMLAWQARALPVERGYIEARQG